MRQWCCRSPKGLYSSGTLLQKPIAHGSHPSENLLPETGLRFGRMSPNRDEAIVVPNRIAPFLVFLLSSQKTLEPFDLPAAPALWNPRGPGVRPEVHRPAISWFECASLQRPIEPKD